MTALSSDAEEQSVSSAAADAGDEGWVVESVPAVVEVDGFGDERVSHEAAEEERKGARIAHRRAHVLNRMAQTRRSCRPFFAIDMCVHRCAPVTEIRGVLPAERSMGCRSVS